MTASEPSHPTDQVLRSLAERALEVLVYLPAGAFLTALEDVPETVAKGRARVEQELRNAEVVGRFAVGVGWRQLRGQLEWLAGQRENAEAVAGAGGSDTHASPVGPAGPAGPAVPAGGAGHADGRTQAHRQPSARTRTGGTAPRPTSPSRSASPSRRTASPPPPPTRPSPRPESPPRPTTPSRDPEVDHVIPDYDILAASQVVRRLDSLGRDELHAVIRHERATRGRRTILQRAEQLLGDRDNASDDTAAIPGTDGPSRPPGSSPSP